MSKQTYTPSAAERRVVEDLNKAQSKRDKRFARKRVVYGYCHPTHGMSDNLILLPFATKDAHADYLRMVISGALQTADNVDKLRGYCVVRIAYYDWSSKTNPYHPLNPVVVVDIDDLITTIEKAANENLH